MAGDDDVPDYLRGVVQAGSDKEDPFGNPGKPAELGGRRSFAIADGEDDEDDDDDEMYVERGPLIPPVLVLGVVGVMSLLCVGSLSSVVAGGAWVDSAHAEATTQAKEMAKAAVEEEKIIDGIGSRGGNRKLLEDRYRAIEGASGLQQGIAALRFARAVEREVALVGDIRGTPLDERRHRLMLTKRAFEDAMVSWDDASGGVLGTIAVGVGVAEGPPEWNLE